MGTRGGFKNCHPNKGLQLAQRHWKADKKDGGSEERDGESQSGLVVCQKLQEMPVAVRIRIALISAALIAGEGGGVL